LVRLKPVFADFDSCPRRRSDPPASGGLAGDFTPSGRRQFDLNRSSIRPAETKVLDEAASQLKNDPMLRLNVEGYTCNLGTTAHNLALGDLRARAVKDYLVSKGMSGDRLRTVSFGETKPKHDNSRRATRQLNRRVALVAEPQP
jgi:OOP family OmpA-OmpF porin